MRRDRMLAALCCLAFLLSAPWVAQGSAATSGQLFSGSPSFGSDREDILTLVQYSDAMVHCASVMKRSRKGNCIFIRHTDEVRFGFWVWRDETGRIINRTLQGSYRMRPPGCLERFCISMECRIPAAPAMVCDDGIERTWSAPDRIHFEIDGNVFERIRQE